MKYHDAVVRVRDIGNRMIEHSEAAERASRTYEAHMSLFNVAASAGDEKAMEEHRNALHSTVDIILDSGAMIAALKRDQQVIANSVTDFPRSV